MQAIMTLWGLERYMNANNDSLFADLVLPEGADKSTLVDVILDQYGEFEVSDSNPMYIKEKVRMWSNMKQVPMLKAWKALTLEYDFQDNYDRHEDTTTTNENHLTHSAHTDTNTTGKVSAYDSSDFQNHDQAISHGEDGGGSDNNGTIHTTGRIHGNIGVTTTMQLLKEEMQVAAMDFYTEVAKWFGQQFVLLIY